MARVEEMTAHAPPQAVSFFLNDRMRAKVGIFGDPAAAIKAHAMIDDIDNLPESMGGAPRCMSSSTRVEEGQLDTLLYSTRAGTKPDENVPQQVADKAGAAIDPADPFIKEIPKDPDS